MASRVLRSLSAIVAEAQRRGYVAQNVCAGVQVRKAQRDKVKAIIPPKTELKALIEAARASNAPMAPPLVMTLIFTGLRASELRGLAWRSIDLNNATLTVDQRADDKGVIGPPKSAAGHRTIPLPSVLVSALRVWKLQCPASDAGLVFPSIASKVMTYRYMSLNVLAPVQINAGLFTAIKNDDDELVKDPRYTMHDFRHAAASLWIEQRVNPKRVQSWMGHSSIQVTFDTYGHLFDQADQDSAVAEAVQREVLGDTLAT
nr:site-specific integrase [Aquisediminimonas sediminicola]